MTARARLDADRTAEPLTRIEHHPPHGGCISPYMPLVNPEYVDENGKRTPLGAPVAAADPLEAYWHERMAERMPLFDEVARLVTVLKGFYLDEQRDFATLLDFYSNAERPYGNKNVEQSIAFNLGWDRDRVLREHAMPEWVEANARELHRLAGAKVREAAPVHGLTPSEVALAKIVVTQRFSDYHAAIDGTAGRKWGCGKTIDEAVGALVRNHPEAFGTSVDLSKVGVL